MSRQGALIVTEMGSEDVNSLAGFGAEFFFSAPCAELMRKSKAKTMHSFNVILLVMNLLLDTDIKISRHQLIQIIER
jgi:hypothetical protein